MYCNDEKEEKNGIFHHFAVVRFGRIMALKAKQDVFPGDEITVNYGYKVKSSSRDSTKKSTRSSSAAFCTTMVPRSVVPSCQRGGRMERSKDQDLLQQCKQKVGASFFLYMWKNKSDSHSGWEAFSDIKSHIRMQRREGGKKTHDVEKLYFEQNGKVKWWPAR